MDNLKETLESVAEQAANYIACEDPEMMSFGLDLLLKVSQIHKNLQIVEVPEDPVSQEVRDKPTTELIKIAKSSTTSKP